VNLISVVIPLYNVEKYVKQCAECFLRQSFKDFELIFVDDFSSDNTLEIVKNIKKITKDNRIKIFANKKSNAGAARNFGLSKAKGKWVIFFDGDDFCTDDFLEKMYKKAELFDCDAVICASLEFSEKKQKFLDHRKSHTFVNLDDRLENCAKNLHEISLLGVLPNGCGSVESGSAECAENHSIPCETNLLRPKRETIPLCRRGKIRKETAPMGPDTASSGPDAISIGPDTQETAENPFLSLIEPWNKIYKKEFLEKNNIKFPENLLCGEDTPFSYEVLFKAQKISFIKEKLVFIRRRKASLSFTTNRNWKSYFEAYDISDKIALEYKYFDEIKDAYFRRKFQALKYFYGKTGILNKIPCLLMLYFEIEKTNKLLNCRRFSLFHLLFSKI